MSESVLGNSDMELARVLSNPENVLMSDALVDRLNLDANVDAQEVIDANLESSFAALLEIADIKLACPILLYSKTSKYNEVLFLISEEQVPYLFNIKDEFKLKLVTKNAIILKELIMTPNDETEMHFDQEGYVKVRVRLRSGT